VAEISEDPGPVFEPLHAGEELLVDPDELYLRQCSPLHFSDGQVSDLLFKQSSQDGGKLSGSRSSRCTPEEAYEFRVKTLGKPSSGTWGVTVGDIVGAMSRVVDDSGSESAPSAPIPPGHAYLDFRHVKAKADERRLRSTLTIIANRSGPAFLAEE
jgi:hypothetical protein